MPSGFDKRERKKAVLEERQRRWRANEAASPLSRAQLDGLLDYLAERIVEEGHDNTFAHTLAWLAGKSMDPEPVLAFLRHHKCDGDYMAAIKADPHHLFGPTAERLARMPIDREALEELMLWLQDRCGAEGCDNTPRFMRQWLSSRALPVATTEIALLAQGGGCDCEVYLNVDPEFIYP